MELLLVGMSVAFFLALLDDFIDFLTLLVNPIFINAFFAIGLSIGANELIGYPVKELVLRTFAGAFFGRVLLTGAEKLASYRSATITSRQ
jgi:hypothetical protein